MANAKTAAPITNFKRPASQTLSSLLIPTSGAIDLAEGRSPGHARRVAYIATALADVLDLEPAQQLAACYAGLLHDVGVIASGTGLVDHVRGDERLVFASMPLLTPAEAASATDDPRLIESRIIDHVKHGTRALKDLGLPPEAVAGVATHHERWDGTGYPKGLTGEKISPVGRVVGLADQIEALIDDTTPLLARRNFHHWLNRMSGAEAEPAAITALAELAEGDSFWLGLFSADLSGALSARCQGLREPRSQRLEPFIESFAQLLDSRFDFTAGVSTTVADVACDVARAAGLSEERVRRLRIAALLHDIGQMSLSERILAKPGILSVDELETLRLHPEYSREIVLGIEGLEEESEWVACHHERLDGRGYPEGLKGDEIPVESRILAIADAYVAITSDRPHRPREDESEAQRQLRAASGTQFDADLVEAFLRAAESTKTQKASA